MGMRLRLGPFSVSSSGRVGASVGPLSVSGGGRRRRRRADDSAIGAFFGIVIAVGIVVVVVMWPLCLVGHAVHLTPSWHQLWNRDHAWMHQHYPLVGLRFIGVGVLLLIATGLASVPVFNAVARDRNERELREAQAYQRWLDGPPPPLTMPARFTQNWIAANVPHLHPGQVPTLMRELRARGWSDDRIADRVAPFLRV
jgi:hypothetical protein